jgi:hypothetical protein
MYESVVIAMQWLQTNIDQGWSTWEDVRDDFDLYSGPLHEGFVL